MNVVRLFVRGCLKTPVNIGASIGFESNPRYQLNYSSVPKGSGDFFALFPKKLCCNFDIMGVCLKNLNERTRIMPDIGKVLKSEIARISKREANSLLSAHIKTIRSLKRELAELKKQIGKKAVTPSADLKSASIGKPEGKRSWITSKGVAGMRKRLGLTRLQMATLCGVSTGAVVLWETSKAGKLNLRSKTHEALSKLRQMSPAAARKAL